MSDAMHLTKHHGLGNDFLLLIDMDDRVPVDAATARSLCDRRRGLGADGFIRVSPAPAAGDGLAVDVAEVVMTLHNADGSLAEMSGNGIRCLGQAMARHRGVTSLELAVATGGGLRRLRVGPAPGDDPTTAWVEVDMGPARRAPEGFVLPPSVEPTKTATVGMGNPHLVFLVDDPALVGLTDLGPQMSAQFPEGINVEVVALAQGQPDTLDLRVWERGAGITQACGTGACAAAHAAYDWGLVGERVRVRMPGGEVEVTLGPTVNLAGPATFIADVVVPT